jgi:hypothetical protein
MTTETPEDPPFPESDDPMAQPTDEPTEESEGVVEEGETEGIGPGDDVT